VAILGALLFPGALAAKAQSALPVNPQAVEFDLPDPETEVTGYRVELFHSKADTDIAQPVNSLEIARTAASESRGRVRVVVSQLFAGVPDGEYVVTLQTLGPKGPSRRSPPAGPFRLSGHFNGEPRPAAAGEPVQPSSSSTDTPPEHEKGGRFWTIVGIAMGVVAIILPLILK
jgi:hypothetical protein